MAQRQLTFPKIRPQTKTYVVLIGHETIHLLHPELFTPRALALDKDGKPAKSDKGFDKTYDIPEYELHDKTVKAWSSKQTHYGELDGKNRSIINSIKRFLNTEQWKCLVVFHSTECRIQKQYTYGNHLHIVVETTQNQLSRDGIYRSMQENITKIGGICTLREVKHDVQGFVKYLVDDDEKIFLGANSDDLREMYKAAANYKQTNTWELGEDSIEAPEVIKRKAIPYLHDVTGKKLKDSEEADEETQVPLHLNKQKAADNINFVTEILRKNRECTDINELAMKYHLRSETGKALCGIALSSNGQKTFNLAQMQIQEERERMTLEDLVKELPDKMDNYMDVDSSQAIFNAWCIEQNISPRKMAMNFQMLLGEKSYKKIGIYLQGRPNSGKTALTNNMWQCLGRGIIGRITKETFLFQDCAGKKLIIGEETTITEATIERFKDLLSGGTLMCEIKNKAPAECTPKIVLLNSNNRYTLNLNRPSAEQIAVRIFNYESLKVTQILKEMTGHFHPRLFYDNVIPIQQDEIVNLMHNTGVWDMEPIGHKNFTGDWAEVHADITSLKVNSPTETTAKDSEPATQTNDSDKTNNIADQADEAPEPFTPNASGQPANDRPEPELYKPSDDPLWKKYISRHTGDWTENPYIDCSPISDTSENYESAGESQNPLLETGDSASWANKENVCPRRSTPTETDTTTESQEPDMQSDMLQREMVELAEKAVNEAVEMDGVGDFIYNSQDWKEMWETQKELDCKTRQLEPSTSDNTEPPRKKGRLSLRKVNLSELIDYTTRTTVRSIEKDATTTINAIFQTCHDFYSNRYEEDAHKWSYYVERDDIRPEDYHYRPRQKIWLPQTTDWTRHGPDSFDYNAFYPVWSDNDDIDYAATGLSTKCILQVAQCSPILELIIPPILTRDTYVAKVIITCTLPLDDDDMINYAFSKPDCPPLYPTEYDDNHAVGYKVFNYMRAFRVWKDLIFGEAEKNNDMKTIAHKLFRVMETQSHTMDDSLTMRYVCRMYNALYMLQ